MVQASRKQLHCGATLPHVHWELSRQRPALFMQDFALIGTHGSSGKFQCGSASVKAALEWIYSIFWDGLLLGDTPF